MTKKVAVIGCGHWGKNLVRNFALLGALGAICDRDETLLAKFKTEYPDVICTTRFEDLITNPVIDALVIATPSRHHYPIAKACLLADKDVYIEKPLATSLKEAQELIQIAQRLDKIIMVGHLLLYHPAVCRLRQLIVEGALGEIKYIESLRLNLNKNRPDKSVLWDLAPHDLSLMMYLLGENAKQVLSAQGLQTAEDGLVDVAQVNLAFESGIQGHIHTSWVHPVKEVRVTVTGTKALAILDDTLPWKEKLKLRPTEESKSEAEGTQPVMPAYDTPEVLTIEPLKLECQHFLHCIESRRQPKSDGDNGQAVVACLEVAENLLLQSLKSPLSQSV